MATTHSEFRDIPAVLRPEARRLSWSMLTESQKSAFDAVVTALARTIVELDAEQKNPSRDLKSAFETAQTTSNQTYLLSGDRGTGKSSLYWTLKRATIDGVPWDSADQHLRSSNQRFDECCRKCEFLQGRLLWLEPLEVEFLPAPTNLLAAILARVEELVQRLGAESQYLTDRHPPQGILADRPAYEKAVMQLLRLQTDASLTWDGNLRDRRGRLDPDNFAAETIRSEYARMRLPAEFTRVLDQLARNVTWSGVASDPLFVLPIDDFDLDPVHAWHLVRVLRMMKVPRLFVLVMGNVTILETILQLQMTGRMADVAGIGFESQASAALDNDIRQESRSTSRHALRKILPPQQRSWLHYLTVEESLARVFETDPLQAASAGAGDGSIESGTLWGILERIPIDHPNPPTLLDLVARTPFNPEVVPMHGGWLSDWAYQGSGVLSLPIRHWHDLAYELQSRAANVDWCRGRFGGFLVERFRERLSDASGISMAAEAQLRECFSYRHQTNDTELLPPIPLQLTGSFSRAWRSPRQIDEGPRLSVSSRPEWTATVDLGGQPQGVLTPQQFAAFAALHDYCVLKSEKVAEYSIVPESSELCLARTEWKSPAGTSIHVPWLAPPFTTIWHWDHFSDFCSYEFTSLHTSQGDLQDIIGRIVSTWVEAGTLLVTDVKLKPHPTRGVPITDRCQELIAILERMANVRLKRQSVRPIVSDIQDGWLIHLALLMAPESGLLTDIGGGLAPEIAGLFLKSSALRQLWCDNGFADEIRRLRAHTAARFLLAGIPADQLFAPQDRTAGLLRIVDRSLELLLSARDVLRAGKSRLRLPRDFKQLGREVRENLRTDILASPDGTKAQQLVEVLLEFESKILSSSVSTAEFDVTQLQQAREELAAFHDQAETLNMVQAGQLCPSRDTVEQIARESGWSLQPVRGTSQQ